MTNFFSTEQFMSVFMVDLPFSHLSVEQKINCKLKHTLYIYIKPKAMTS